MPIRHVNLTDEQDAFLEEVVRSGKYQNASEAMRDALRGLEFLLKADEFKLELLRTQVQVSRDALDRGGFTDVDDVDLNAALDDCERLDLAVRDSEIFVGALINPQPVNDRLCETVRRYRRATGA